ncbi:hypothetical protein ACFQZE_07220 [Paenibacillus sp. GCM10027627]|uniref:hypothetical protein n=1 Tax=unclassified Paenibacillus TaxID=185978 RepID=UPI00362B9A88
MVIKNFEIYHDSDFDGWYILNTTSKTEIGPFESEKEATEQMLTKAWNGGF